MSPVFVAIEGLSGVGKSTTADLLATRLHAARVPTVVSEFDQIRGRIQAQDELNARYLLFLSAICLASLDVQATLEDGYHVVVESYIARTVAYHRGMGATASVVLGRLAIPDVTIYLTCEAQERVPRLGARGAPRHIWDSLAERCKARIDREYRTFPMHVIDTTDHDPGSVVDVILRHPLNGGCDCANYQPVASHPNLLSALPLRT